MHCSSCQLASVFPRKASETKLIPTICNPCELLAYALTKFSLPFILQPFLLQPTRSDPEIRHQHVPSVLPGVRQGHRLQEADVNTSPAYVLCLKEEKVLKAELAVLSRQDTVVPPHAKARG